MDTERVVVVGTTCDYIDLIRRRHPGRAFFLTERGLRERAFEPAPPPDEEALCDLGDHAGALKTLKTALVAANIRPTGIACYDCESLPLACEAAARFALPFAPWEAVEAARNKWTSKRLWHDAGVPCPDAGTASDARGLEDLLSRIGLPVVLKPMTGAGSELVFRCATRPEALAAFETIRRTLAGHPDDRLYPESASADANPDTQAPSPRRDVLCERCVEGPEFSCDFLLRNRKVRIIRIASKLPAPELGTGTARAYIVPAHAETGLDLSLFAETLRDAARSLGFTEGLFMVDFILEGGKPYLLEMTPRPSGDCLPWLIEASSGLDTISLELDYAEGKPLNLPELGDFERLVGLRLFAPRRGTVHSFDTAKLEADPRVRQVRLYRRPGHRVEFPPVDYAARVLGHAVFAPTPGADLRQECDELAAKFLVRFEEAS
jgi:biotin carboxylase